MWFGHFPLSIRSPYFESRWACGNGRNDVLWLHRLEGKSAYSGQHEATVLRESPKLMHKVDRLMERMGQGRVWPLHDFPF